MRWVVAVAVAAVLAVGSRAGRAEDAVALLPLEADAPLQIYGQPVASEVARALAAGGIAVVVVGPKMTVPDRASVVVDGKIVGGRGDTVTLSLRIRDRETGAVLDTVPDQVSPLASIDQAAAQLSALALPRVRGGLAAVARRRAQEHAPPPAHPATIPATAPVHAPGPPPALRLAVDAGEQSGVPLRDDLSREATAWTRAHHREARPIAMKLFAGTGAGSGPELALEILSYEARDDSATGATFARARVRARIADGARVVFDRVIVTDTVVGDRGRPRTELAVRVAREVLAILTPHVARVLPDLAGPGRP